MLVAACIEELGLHSAPPTVQQNLAAIRTLFDFLVIGQVIPFNPAASVRGPKHVVKKGKTPVLSSEDARATRPDLGRFTVHFEAQDDGTAIIPMRCVIMRTGFANLRSHRMPPHPRPKKLFSKYHDFSLSGWAADPRHYREPALCKDP